MYILGQRPWCRIGTKRAANPFTRAISYAKIIHASHRALRGNSVTNGSSTAKAFDSGSQDTKYGLFISSGSPAVAEILSHSGVDWLCLDTQHGAVGYAELAGLLQATASGRSQAIVRVGGPTDRFGIQQALDQGAGGVMVPLVNSVAEAREVLSYCKFPPEGQRSLVAPSRAILIQEGVCSGAVGRYLRQANRRVQVWLQVESVQCLESLDEILAAIPGIDCMFLGPADMAVSMGLLGDVRYGSTANDPLGTPISSGFKGSGSGDGGGGAPYPDLAAALASPEMAKVHNRVLEACNRAGVAAGCFCVGPLRARQLAALGYRSVGFDVDTNMLLSAAAEAMKQLRSQDES